MKSPRRLAAALLPTCLLATLAGATTIIAPADPGALAVQSEGVFLARAGASSTIPRMHVSTVTELTVLEVLKGRLAVGERVEVVAPGGRLGDEIWLVPGAPGFAEGEV
jgi:hypothetical protein